MPIWDGCDFEPGHETALAHWIEKEIEDTKTYFSRLNGTSQAVSEWLNGGSRWGGLLAEAIRSNQDAIAALAPESFSYATELDAHNKHLRRIQQYGSNEAFQAKYFKLIYCFPFIIANRSTNKIVLWKELSSKKQAIFDCFDAFCADPSPDADLSEREFWMACAPSELQEAAIADVWASVADFDDDESDRGDHANTKKAQQNGDGDDRLYSLYQINIADIVVHDVKDPSKTILLHGEIRLSAFGNHYVKLYAECGNQHDFYVHRQPNEGWKASQVAITHSDIYRALRRSSSFSGKEPISSRSYSNYNATDPEGAFKARCNLQDVVEMLLSGFDQALHPFGMYIDRDIAKTANIICSMSEFDERAEQDSADESIAQRSLFSTPWAREQRRKKLNDALHQLFLNPIGGPADRFEPWLGRSSSTERGAVGNLARSELGDDAEIYLTANTTLLRLPSHANFVRFDYEDMVEFVATLEPLYTHWNKLIAEKMQRVVKLLDEGLPKWTWKNIFVGPREVKELGNEKIELQKLIADAKGTMVKIELSRIVTNEIYRRYLNDFLGASSVRSLRQEFDHLVETSQGVVNTVVDYITTDQQNRISARLGVAGLIIAALGLFQITDIDKIPIVRGFCLIPAINSVCSSNSAADRTRPAQIAPSLPDRIEATPLSR